MALAIYSANLPREESLRLLRRIFKYFKPYKLYIFLACVCMVVVALTSAGNIGSWKLAKEPQFYCYDVFHCLIRLSATYD